MSIIQHIHSQLPRSKKALKFIYDDHASYIAAIVLIDQHLKTAYQGRRTLGPYVLDISGHTALKPRCDEDVR
jgi:hypothetical protein